MQKYPMWRDKFFGKVGVYCAKFSSGSTGWSQTYKPPITDSQDLELLTCVGMVHFQKVPLQVPALHIH